MKKQILIGLVLLGTLTAGRAALYYQGTGVGSGTYMGAVANPSIVDGNPAIVIANTMTLSGLGSSLSSFTVTLNLSGGYNNGLYAYLVHGGTTVTLLNQPGYAVNGFGATGAGMNITLQDGSTDHGSIQSEISGSVLSGTYNAANSLSGFSGDPNGAWSLYFSDTLAGGGDATLQGWSLNITAVPEPVNVALAIFGGVLGVWSVSRRWTKRVLAV
ncbi:MAG: hypothetical protein WCS42_01935 [Verrucomicrobiota bacterium]